jgi:hypothetical protein
MAPGDSSAGLVRLKPIAELFGPVVTDESDPLPVFMGADGHSNNTGELQATAEALLWFKVEGHGAKLVAGPGTILP